MFPYTQYFEENQILTSLNYLLVRGTSKSPALPLCNTELLFQVTRKPVTLSVPQEETGHKRKSLQTPAVPSVRGALPGWGGGVRDAATMCLVTAAAPYNRVSDLPGTYSVLEKRTQA